MKRPTLPHRATIYDALRLYCDDGKEEGPVTVSTHPRVLVLQQALGRNDEDGLPASVWSVTVTHGSDPDDDVLAALGGNLDPNKGLSLNSEEALPIGRAIVSALDGRQDTTGPRGEALQKPRVGTGAQVGSLVFHGGHLRRTKISVCPGTADRSPLAWAVACWLALRPLGKVKPDRLDLGPPAAEPVMLTHVAEDGSRRSIWGEFTPADLRRLDRQLAEGKGTPDDESTAAVAAWMAAAERERDILYLLLDGEVDHLKEAAKALEGSAKSWASSDHCKEAVRDRRRAALAKELIGLRPDATRLVEVRARVSAMLKKKQQATVPLWIASIVASEAEHWEQVGAQIETTRWQVWPALTFDEPGLRKGDITARRAAWHLQAGDSWAAAMLRVIAGAGLERACKRLPCETAGGAVALVALWASLGFDWRYEHAEGSDGAWRTKRLGYPNPLIAVAHETAEEATRECKRALRVAIERAVGLAVELVATDEEARRLVCGPEVAARVGRGQVAVIAERPPRVIIGGAEQLALAGLVSLEIVDGILTASRSEREKWAGDEADALWKAALRVLRRALAAGAEVPTIEVVAQQVAPRAEDPEGGRWRPALLGGLAFEWLRGSEVLLRWRPGDLLVEVVLQDGAPVEVRAWSAAGVEIELDPQALVLEEWLTTAEHLERALPVPAPSSVVEAEESDSEATDSA